MSGTFPASNFSRIRPSSNFNTLVSSAHSGRTYTRELSGHKWIFDVSFTNLTRDEFELINGFLLAQYGAASSFQISFPHKNTPRGIATGVPLIAGAGQTGKNLLTDGWTISQTGIMKAGDVLTISGDTKVYEVNTSANSNGSGAATLPISPPLIETPTDNAAITVNNVQYTMRTDDLQVYEVEPGLFYDLDIKLIEFY